MSFVASGVVGSVRGRVRRTSNGSGHRSVALPASKAWHLAGVRFPALGVSLASGPMLSWGLRLSRVSSRPDLGGLSPALLLPWASLLRPSTRIETTHELIETSVPSEYHSVRRPTAGSRRHAFPLEVSNLIFLLRSSKPPSALAHEFTSGAEPRCRAPHALFGLSETPTGAP
jgi:hypothetical protein